MENAQEAILTHVEGLLKDNEILPKPSSIEELKRNVNSDEVTWGLVHVDLAKLSRTVKRINVTIPENILSKIDSFAQREGETRSGLLAIAALEYISQHRSSIQ
jgi:hypothetical protein